MKLHSYTCIVKFSTFQGENIIMYRSMLKTKLVSIKPCVGINFYPTPSLIRIGIQTLQYKTIFADSIIQKNIKYTIYNLSKTFCLFTYRHDV